MKKTMATMLFAAFAVCGFAQQSVTGLSLINADTDLPIAGYDPIADGATLDLNTLPTRNLNIAATTDPDPVGSVYYSLTGAETHTQTETVQPYALKGDTSGDFNAWTPPVGSYSLIATPYTASGASGTAGTPLTINFDVTDSAGSTPTPVGTYQESGGLVVMEAENTDSALGNWAQKTIVSGYTGAGHLEFLGNDYTTGPADSPLEYTFKIETAGLYYLHLRASKIDVTIDGTLRDDVANDCYVRVEGDYNAGPAPYDSEGDNASLAVLTADTKYYTYSAAATGQWKWEDGIGNGFGNLDTSAGKRDALYDFKAGETYTLVVSGRSKSFRLDRIVFRHVDTDATVAENTSTPESTIATGNEYIYDATEDFPTYITPGFVPFYIDNGNDALAIAANIESNRTGFAQASRSFDGESGIYNVTITTLTEEDGESTYKLLVNGVVVDSFENTYIGEGSPLDMQEETHTWYGITINNGDTIAIQANADTNGEIPETGGTAWSRGRWRQIEVFTPKTFNPPMGRLAYVADGNSRDPDDIGANAVMMGLLHGTDLQDRLVHFSHSCDLVRDESKITEADNLRRQAYMHQEADEGIAHFGPFSNLSDVFNCSSNQTAAVANLTAAINASTATDPLWIIEAGEPDIIGYALQAANASAIPYVHVVSHHPANDDSGDFFTWQQILDFGVTEHQIGDQNVGLQVLVTDGDWDWAEGHEDPAMVWILDQLKYAEADGVASFQDGKYDCSDAGMVYWWITGADNGGNKNSTPTEIKAMLLAEDGPAVETEITMVVLGTPVDSNVGTTWSDGLPPHVGANYYIPATGNLRGETGTTTFPGDSLTVEAGGKFQVRSLSTSSEITTVNNLVLAGGADFATLNFVQLAAGTGTDVDNVLNGTITQSGATRLVTYGGSNNRSLKILSTIDGTGILQANGGATVTIANMGNTFSGTWEVGASSTLVFSHAAAVGTADVDVLDYGALQVLGAWDTDASLTVASSTNAFVEFGDNNWGVGSLTIGTTSVSAGTYTADELNAMGSAVFTGAGSISVEVDPPQPPYSGLIAGWDVWDNAAAPSANVTADNITASAVTTSEDPTRPWHTNDERGSSSDGTWGGLGGSPVASTIVATGECMGLPNAVTGGTMTFTITNGGTEDVVLNAFHFDALAFRRKAARTYELSVLEGSDVTPGVIFTSDAQVITELGAVPTSYDLHDEFDHDLTGLADHTLEPGETVQFLLTFSGGAGDASGGHDLWVDNVGVSKVLPEPSDNPEITVAMNGGNMEISWTETGFKVQSRESLTGGQWEDYENGTTNPVTIVPTNSSAFFRLIEQ